LTPESPRTSGQVIASRGRRYRPVDPQVHRRPPVGVTSWPGQQVCRRRDPGVRGAPAPALWLCLPAVVSSQGSRPY